MVEELVSFFVRVFGFYGISTFVGYLLPSPFLYKKQKQTVIFQTIQFSISTQFHGQKHFFSSYSI